MRIFKVIWFARWARRQGLDDAVLKAAIDEIGKGLIDAKLGGELVKKRIARPGRGKSAGYRVIIAVRVGRRAFFLFGFAKHQMTNIPPDDLADFKKVAAELLRHPDSYLDDLIDLGELIEVE